VEDELYTSIKCLLVKQWNNFLIVLFVRDFQPSSFWFIRKVIVIVTNIIILDVNTILLIFWVIMIIFINPVWDLWTMNLRNAEISWWWLATLVQNLFFITGLVFFVAIWTLSTFFALLMKVFNNFVFLFWFVIWYNVVSLL